MGSFFGLSLFAFDLMPVTVTLSMPWHVTIVDLLAMALGKVFFCHSLCDLRAVPLRCCPRASVLVLHACMPFCYSVQWKLASVTLPLMSSFQLHPSKATFRDTEESPAWVMAVLSTCYHSQLSVLRSQLKNGGESIPGFLVGFFSG